MSDGDMEIITDNINYEDKVFFKIADKEYCNEELALSILLKEGILFANSRNYVQYDYKDCNKYTIEPETVVLFVNCNDLFAWGCADGEEITFEEIPQLYKAWKSGNYGVDKWCCRKRKLRPQEPVIEKMKADGAWDKEMEALPIRRRI